MKPKNHILPGLLFGLLVPAVAMVLVYLLAFPGFRFLDFFRYAFAKNFLENLVSLCGLANLPLFYIYIRTRAYEAVKGVIMATFLLVIVVVILKFLV